MPRIEDSRGGRGAAAGEGRWGGGGVIGSDVELLYSAFPSSSDDDSEDDDASTPFSRKRIGSISRGRRTGVAAAVAAVPRASTSPASAPAPASLRGGGGGTSGAVAAAGSAAQVSSSSGCSGGGGGSGGSGAGSAGSQSGGDDLRPDITRAGGGELDKEGLGGRRNERGSDEVKEVKDKDKCKEREGAGGDLEDKEGRAEEGVIGDDEDSATDATSVALASGDTDIEEEMTTAAGLGALAEAEMAGGEGGRLTTSHMEEGEEEDDRGEGKGGAEEEEREDEEAKQDVRPCPLCRESFPLTKLDAHVDVCLDADASSANASAAAGASGDGGGSGSGSTLATRFSQGAAGCGGSGGREAEGKGECPMCSELVPIGELLAHTNMCCDKQARELEEKEKREERAKRQRRSVLVRPPVAFKGFGGGGGPSDGERGRSFRGRTESKPVVFDATTTANSSSSTGGGGGGDSEAEHRKTSAAAKRERNRRGGGSTAGGATASGGGKGPGTRPKSHGMDPPKQQRKEKTGGKKLGKGKAKLVPSSAIRHGFRCPQKLRGRPIDGCGAINAETAHRCCKCNLRFWESFPFKGASSKLQLGDEVTFLETPHLAKPDEKKTQEGFIYSFVNDGSSGRVMARCTYKHFPGYVSGAVDFRDISAHLPRRAQVTQAAGVRNADGSGGGGGRGGDGGDDSGGAGSSSGGGGSSSGGGGSSSSGGGISSSGSGGGSSSSSASGAPRGQQGKQASSAARGCSGGGGSGGGLSSLSSAKYRSSSSSSSSLAGSATGVSMTGAASGGCASAADRSIQSWGKRNCEHVVAGEACNYKNGRCRSCYKEFKRAKGMTTATPFGDDGGDDLAEVEEQEESRNRRNLEDSTVECETPGCGNGHFQLGVCCSCFARHRERVAKIEAARKEEENNLPPCRACEGLLTDSEHAQCIRNANAMESVSVQLDENITGRCSVCKAVGGRGRHDQLLLCDGIGCAISTHMRCLLPELNQVPRGWWFCDVCVETKNMEKSQHSCTACHSMLEDEKLLVCDGYGCQSHYHFDCLPVPVDSAPEGDWFCPRCAHGGNWSPSDSRGAHRDEGRSDGADGSARSPSSSSSPAREGGAAKRKRGGPGGGSSGGPRDGGAPRKKATKISGERSSNSRQKRPGSSHAGSGRASPLPPPDLCASPLCGVLDARAGAGRALLDVKVKVAAAPAAPAVGGGDADSAAGLDLEVLAAREAEDSRWRCGSDRCRGEASNSYHKRCLQRRRTYVMVSEAVAAAAAKAAAKAATAVATATAGTTAMAATKATAATAATACGVATTGPGPSSAVAMGTAAAVAGGDSGADVSTIDGKVLPAPPDTSMDVEVVTLPSPASPVSSMDVDVLMPPLPLPLPPAGARGGEDKDEEREGDEEEFWTDDFVCPACGSMVATQEEAARAAQGILRYRVFAASLAWCFNAEFGKSRWEVEEDRRGLGIKGSKTIAGNPCRMYGSIYEGVVDFMFRTCGLSSRDCFLDIGSGIGPVVMQAAAWAGCRALGVEVVKERHDAAVRLLKKFKLEATNTALDHNALAAVRLIEGDFVEKWNELTDCTVIFLNNESGWFKERNPDRAKDSYEAKLVGLLQELDRSVKLVTMERMDMCPQGWTHEEHTYRSSNVEERIATFRAGAVKMHFYVTNAGSWSCKGCLEVHDKSVTECNCLGRSHLRRRRGFGDSIGTRSSSSSSSGSTLA